MVINMTDKRMNEAAATFVGNVKQSAEYLAYAAQLEEIKKQPELFEEVNAFRLKNFQIQNAYDGDELLERMDELDRESEWLRGNPLVGRFLEAEIAFCRMMQEVNMLIADQLDFE